MSPKLTAEEQSIRSQVEQSESALDGLETELLDIDDELDELADEHHKYELLERACRSLAELDDIGASHLFWDADDDERGARFDHAQRQIDEFKAEVSRVEDRREALLAKIEEQNVELDYLHYDLQDILEQQEDRDGEWVVEREETPAAHRALVMPWTRGCQEDQRFQRSLATSLVASFVIAILLSTIALPVLEREPEIELPERMARLVREERPIPPPPVPIAEPDIPEEDPEASPELVEELPDEPIPASTDAPQLADATPDTREQVKSKGILAFRESFASRADARPSARLGSQARISAAGGDSVGRPERMMVTTSAPGSSGGINLASISRDFGGGGGGGGDGDGIGGVEVARVSSSIGGGGDGPARPLAGGGALAGRTDEEIQIVFDRYKAALYRLYNRELRNDPTLRGQLVLRLTIEPDGSVSLCELHSTNMNSPLLADQVVSRVRTFDFGAKEDIVAVTIIYPIDFLPAA
ncbi:MAG: AgmX/PglI C-terminal domain-containing protein [Woeseiaceae bacterium]|nr:AgmX/PglI C-terminal domain-containing protein [Woeseiaceae bacterium]